MNTVATLETPTISSSDVAYSAYVEATTAYPFEMDQRQFDAIERAFLLTPAYTADGINRKLQILEGYFDETGEYEYRDLIRIVIRLVCKGEIDDALRFASVIDIDEILMPPIRAAIADMERCNEVKP